MPDSNSLHVLILDVSPLAWGERNLRRQVSDKQQAARGKDFAVGPVVLDELLQAVQAFGGAACSMERDAGLIVFGVADQEIAVVYPRKDVLAQWLDHPESYQPNREVLATQLTSGVADLVAQAAAAASQGHQHHHAAMAAAFSRALCLINRFLVAAKSAVGLGALSEDRFLQRTDNVVAFSGPIKTKPTAPASAWAPRILLIQASPDRGHDYNAFMNCAFAAVKHQIVVDGCYLPMEPKDDSSAFLEQACDLTGGVFLAPSGRAQVQGALAEVLLSVFLSPLRCRRLLNLPALNKVDFRARCFATGQMVDLAFCCNQCLSIFSKKPQEQCPTCGALLADSNTHKRRRTDSAVGSST